MWAASCTSAILPGNTALYPHMPGPSQSAYTSQWHHFLVSVCSTDHGLTLCVVNSLVKRWLQTQTTAAFVLFSASTSSCVYLCMQQCSSHCSLHPWNPQKNTTARPALCKLCKCTCRGPPKTGAPAWLLPGNHYEHPTIWCSLDSWSTASTLKTCSKCSTVHPCSGHLWWATSRCADDGCTAGKTWSHLALALFHKTSASWWLASVTSVQTQLRTSSSLLLRKA